MRLIDADELMESIRKALGIKSMAKSYLLPAERTIIDQIDSAPTVGGWISVKDRMPESGKHVLVTCEIRPIGRKSRQYVCEAFYAGKYCISDVSADDDIAYDYNEEEDEYYLKEGWYECIHNWDEYSSIVILDFVTHWMPLPSTEGLNET